MGEQLAQCPIGVAGTDATVRGAAAESIVQVEIHPPGVEHAPALGIYFFDPEGNRNEVYWAAGREVRQPFRKSIDLSLPVDELVEESDRRVADGTPAYQPATAIPPHAAGAP